MPYQNPYFPQYPQTQYQSQVQPPMDRLSQLQAQQYQMSNIQTVPQTNQGILWVQGEAGAKSYLVAPNTTVLLMDSEGSRFYLKSTDGSGIPSLRTFEYSEVLQNTLQSSKSSQIDFDDKYVTREEYDDLNEKYMEILERLNNFHPSVSVEETTKRTAAKPNVSRGKGGNADE